MTKIFRFFTLATLVVFAACSDDDSASERENLVAELEGTWSDATVSHATDGDLTFQYEDFNLVLTDEPDNGYDGNFLIANGGNAFPESSGQWKLNDDLDQIEFSTGEVIDFEVSDDVLVLEFTVEAPGGRVNGLSGDFTFELQRQ